MIQGFDLMIFWSVSPKYMTLFLICVFIRFQGCFIAEYVGDLIDEVECQRRLDEAHERNISNFYMLTLDKNRLEI